jgi:RNA polymerase sigma factor (sigma-70 family)
MTDDCVGCPEGRHEVPEIATVARGWPRKPISDEAALLAAVGRGEPDAIARLYARFGRPLFAYSMSLVSNPAVAEEIVQDTFVAAWRGASRFEGRSSLASWLFGIARRQARDRLRHETAELAMPSTLDSLLSSEPGPEAVALIAASRAEVADALNRLHVHHREPLVLAFVHDLSGREIAAILEIPEGTVKSRLHAARRALRAELWPEGPR